MEVRYIRRTELDALKWDSCVHYAADGNVYGYTWFLDNVAQEWDGLVEGDYESVFPLIWNTKLFGLKQLYQPFFAQRHGIYSVHVLSKMRLRAFWEAVPTAFRYANIGVSSSSYLGDLANWQFEKRPNYILPLNVPYETIAENYSENHTRSLKRADREGLIVVNNVKPETLVALFAEHQGKKIKELQPTHYHTAHRLIYNALHRGRGTVSGVTTQSGELLAAAFLAFSHNRLLYLLPTTTPEGRTKRAMHYLLDVAIRMNAERPLLLDFEGSTLQGVASFYEGFGAKPEFYYRATRNILPFWCRWAKK